MPHAKSPLDYASAGTARPGMPRRLGCLVAVGALPLIAFVAWRALLPWAERREGIEMLSVEVPLQPGDAVLEFKPYRLEGPGHSPCIHFKLQLTPANFNALLARLTAQGSPPPTYAYPWPWPVPPDGVAFAGRRAGWNFLLSPGTSVVYVSIWYD